MSSIVAPDKFSKLSPKTHSKSASNLHHHPQPPSSRHEELPLTSTMDISERTHKTTRIAAVQMAPVFMNKQATTDKVCQLIQEAGAHGASFVGFPECIIPGYPGWIEFMRLGSGRALELYHDLFENSVEVPGPETEQIAEACRTARVGCIVGINEKRSGTTGTTWNTQLLFDSDGRLLNKHQKFVPTIGERLIHAPGRTGAAIGAKTMAVGPVSGLICGENSNFLAAYSMSLEYPLVHVASWPGHFSSEMDMHECISVATRGLAYGVKCFVINSVALLDDTAIDMCATTDEDFAYLRKMQQRPGATIIGPLGQIIAGPLPPDQELLYADVCFDDIIKGKYCHDIAGHYQRPEIFSHHFVPSSAHMSSASLGTSSAAKKPAKAAEDGSDRSAGSYVTA